MWFLRKITFMFDKSNETFDSDYKPNKIEVEHPPNYESYELPCTTEEELESSSSFLPTIEEVPQED